MTTFKVFTLSAILIISATSNCMETATTKKEQYYEIRIAQKFSTDRQSRILCEFMDFGAPTPIKTISLPLAVLKSRENNKMHLTTKNAIFHLEPVTNPHLRGKTFEEQLNSARLNSIKY